MRRKQPSFIRIHPKSGASPPPIHAKDLHIPSCGLLPRWKWIDSISALDNEKIQRQLQEILGNPLEKAIEFTEKGVRINPNKERAQAILALVRFYSNELAPALEEVKRAFELNANSLFVLDGLTYIMILSGEWGRGDSAGKEGH